MMLCNVRLAETANAYKTTKTARARMPGPSHVPNPTSHPIAAQTMCDQNSSLEDLCPYSRAAIHKRDYHDYGLKLSWPRESDKRRAITLKTPLLSRAPSPSTSAGDADISNARFVHVSQWDIELHSNLTSIVPANEKLNLPIPLTWNPSKLRILDIDLFDYFRCTASQSLAILGHDPVDLGNVLIRLALADDTPSAAAVLHALLAFSSLHRSGVQSQALELKITALGNLAEGSKLGNLDTIEATQHAAAGMLLCCFETHQASCTSNQWTGYISRAKQVIQTSRDGKRQLDSSIAMVRDWMYYHDVLARFSLRHWQRSTPETESPSSPTISHAEVSEQNYMFPSDEPLYLTDQQVSQMSLSALSILELLHQICETVTAEAIADTSLDNINDYKGFLNVLDWRIRSIPLSLEAPADETTQADTLVLRLYQLAMLLYFNRTCESLLNQPTKTQQYVDAAFAILPKLSSCERQFPVFIIGCEAQTDDQRVIIVDLISRTEKKSSSRSFNHTKSMLHAIWAQDDLAASKTSYWDKLSSVITRCSITPTFV